MNSDNELERSIRAALDARAAAAPVRPDGARAGDPRRSVARRAGIVAAAAASVVLVGVAAVALDDGRRELVTVTAPAGPGAAADAAVPRLGFDVDGFRYRHVDGCAGEPSPAQAATVPGTRAGMQTFAASYTASPMVFLTTVAPAQRASFGLVDAERGDPFATRGVVGYASRDRGAAHGWNLSVELSDGQALYAVVLGLELDDVVPVLDGLRPRTGGGWEPTVLPPGLTELEPSQEWRGCGYSASGDLDPSAPGSFEVSLYGDTFDSRVADRAASTRGQITRVVVDGVAAGFGSYRDDDHWVLFEPRPGRTMEIRLSGMSRADAQSHLAHARFVDEATWRSMQP